MSDRPRFYTVPQVCDMLQVSRATLYRATKRGDLYALRVGRALRYPAEAIAAYTAGEPFDPEGGSYMGRSDVATWPPTPSLLDADSEA